MALLLSLLPLCACSGGAEEDAFYDACTPGEIPDAACYAQKRAPGSAAVKLAREIALGHMARHPAATVKWDWGEGVLMYALSELHRVSGDSRLRDYTKAWIDAHLAKGYQLIWSDSCPPALTALELARDGLGAKYQKVVDDVVAYFKEAPRTDEGGISHMGTAVPFVRTLWLDSLFMVGMPVLRQAERAGDKTLLAAVGEQFRIFGGLLQGSTGFLTHAYNWEGQEEGVYWGRGNGWVTAAGHEYLRAARLSGQRDPAVEALLARQARAVLTAQDKTSGLWWTLLTQPNRAYLETSASALFAYGLARGYRYGHRGAEVLEPLRRALAGIKTKVKTGKDGTPQVTGISGPTTVGDAASYARVPLEDDLHFGVGAVILALIETSGLPLD